MSTTIKSRVVGQFNPSFAALTAGTTSKPLFITVRTERKKFTALQYANCPKSDVAEMPFTQLEFFKSTPLVPSVMVSVPPLKPNQIPAT